MRSLLIGRFVLVQRGRTDQLEARGPRVVTHTRITERIPILLPIKKYCVEWTLVALKPLPITVRLRALAAPASFN